MKRRLLLGLVAGFAVLPLCGVGAEPPANQAYESPTTSNLASFTRFEPQPNGRDRYLILHDKQIPRVVATQRALTSQPPSSRGPTRTP